MDPSLSPSAPQSSGEGEGTEPASVPAGSGSRPEFAKLLQINPQSLCLPSN